ncbi:hypothetical protein CALCODRAFT_202710 [Calocera cornea HHB12733]|uniref:Uncharacterized protein n=1 Tax=Calocera cornea HHB12733 TaxID=1353952 RepID=A0A165JY92_9BASI|nr:hypothetical protein CALCODRAFT_202710 [Calocera cornea HHB12733]
MKHERSAAGLRAVDVPAGCHSMGIKGARCRDHDYDRVGTGEGAVHHADDADDTAPPSPPPFAALPLRMRYIAHRFASSHGKRAIFALACNVTCPVWQARLRRAASRNPRSARRNGRRANLHQRVLARQRTSEAQLPRTHQRGHNHQRHLRLYRATDAGADAQLGLHASPKPILSRI